MNDRFNTIADEGPSWGLKFEFYDGDEPLGNLHRDVVFDFIRENLEELNRRFVAEAEKRKIGL